MSIADHGSFITKTKEYTMASLFKAIKNWIRGKRDDAASAIGDPVRDGKFAIEDSKKQIAEYRSQIAKAMAATKQIERERESAQNDVKKYGNIAKQAASMGSEKDVREAVTQKNRAKARVDQLKVDIDRNNKITDNLRMHLLRAEAKIADAENNHTILAARSEGAKARKALAQAHTEFTTGDNPLSALDELENAVNADEAEAEAIEELVGLDEDGMTLEERYGSSGDSNVDAEVEKLMASAK